MLVYLWNYNLESLWTNLCSNCDIKNNNNNNNKTLYEGIALTEAIKHVDDTKDGSFLPVYTLLFIYLLIDLFINLFFESATYQWQVTDKAWSWYRIMKLLDLDGEIQQFQFILTCLKETWIIFP